MTDRSVFCFWGGRGILAAALLAAGLASAQTTTPLSSNVSLRHEVRHAIEKGCAWLETKQTASNYWSSPEHPAVTALVLTALVGPSPEKSASPAIEKGYAYLLSCVQPDGGIYNKDLQSYNTSVALSALVLRNRPQDRAVILNARRFLIGLQVGDAQLGGTNSPFSGGIGYGGTDKLPDLSDTVMALGGDLQQQAAGAGQQWSQGAGFELEGCASVRAKLPEPARLQRPTLGLRRSAKQGRFYLCSRTQHGRSNQPAVRPRRLSFLRFHDLCRFVELHLCGLEADDPRVTSALDWLRGNYTVDENPALGPQGIYYYYELMAKALTFAGVDTMETKDGRKANWREELALKLLNLQHADGSWANENGRWWEKDPNLDSAFAITTLEIIENKL
jgi:squalene-hopene/tetraprenyl-beta-curcumene cyclase